MNDHDYTPTVLVRVVVLLISSCCMSTHSLYANSVHDYEISVERKDHSEDFSAMTNEKLSAGHQFWHVDFASGNATFTAEVLDGASPNEIPSSFPTHPLMVYDLIPFKWDLITDIPVLNLLHEFPRYAGAGEVKFEDLVHSFNIQVNVPSKYEYSYPNNVTLVLGLTTTTEALEMLVPMDLRHSTGSYFVSDPQQLVYRLSIELRELSEGTSGQSRPQMSLLELRGFTFNDETLHDFQILGVPVSHNIRFGNTSVKFGFQWAGQPESLPLRYPQVPFLTHAGM